MRYPERNKNCWRVYLKIHILQISIKKRREKEKKKTRKEGSLALISILQRLEIAYIL